MNVCGTIATVPLPTRVRCQYQYAVCSGRIRRLEIVNYFKRTGTCLVFDKRLHIALVVIPIQVVEYISYEG